MKITEVRPILLSQVYTDDEVWGWSGGEVRVWNSTLVQVFTDKGVYGLGEMGTGHYLPEAAKAICDAISPMLIGKDPFEIEVLQRKLYKLGANWGRRGLAMGVISGIENALWDLKGKALGVPVHSLLGGKHRDRIRAYASGGMAQPLESLKEEVAGYRERGFTAVKVRGGFSAKRDVEIARAAREAAGPDMDVMLDAGQGYVPEPWTVLEAIEVTKVLAELDLFFLEEPVRTDEIDCYAHVRAASAVPIAGGENGCSIYEFKALVDANAVDILQPDVTHAGGISEVKRIAEYAALYGKPIAPHVFRTGASLTAHLHLLAAIPNALICEYQQIANGLREDLLVEPIEMVDGNLIVPDLPGLGIHITDEIIEKYAYKPGHIQRFKVESD
jgi:L-alanine-DL-glutamate epimerase-like enolase superfamily enzyme